MIVFADQKPVAFGSHAAVYRHPADPTILVKVVRPEAVSRDSRKWNFLRGRRRRYFHLKNFLRVLEEQVAVLAAERHSSPYLEEVIGLANTNLGPGLMVRCETLRGNIAPTLDTLSAAGKLGNHLVPPLESFFAWLERSPVVASDLSMRNLVLSDRVDGKLRIVMIDGYGENAAIPLKSWSMWLNRHDKREKTAFIRKRLGLWDPAICPDGAEETANSVP